MPTHEGVHAVNVIKISLPRCMHVATHDQDKQKLILRLVKFSHKAYCKRCMIIGTAEQEFNKLAPDHHYGAIDVDPIVNFFPSACKCTKIAQIVASPPSVRGVYSINLVTEPHHVSYLGQFSTDFFIAIIAIQNLDFFRRPNYPQVLLLEYAIGVYPLFLIFLTVKLLDNLTVVVWLWRPFHRYLAYFRRQWNTQSYLVRALTTFNVLSYVKIPLNFLISSHVYVIDIHGNRVNKAYWYYMNIELL